jgi:hypothetical protein
VVHSGSYLYHDDDCRCVEGGMYCNRDGRCWSCCGACKQDSECTAPEMHPTYPDHACFGATISEYRGSRPQYRSNAEIARIFAEWKAARR